MIPFAIDVDVADDLLQFEPSSEIYSLVAANTSARVAGLDETSHCSRDGVVPVVLSMPLLSAREGSG